MSVFGKQRNIPLNSQAAVRYSILVAVLVTKLVKHGNLVIIIT